MAVFCTACGSRIDPGDRFCGACGRPAGPAATHTGSADRHPRPSARPAALNVLVQIYLADGRRHTEVENAVTALMAAFAIDPILWSAYGSPPLTAIRSPVAGGEAGAAEP
jgi:hypothetical protein